jgi:hypothetical protein
MPHHRILITGQFWDTDFADLLNNLAIPSTLIAAEKLATLQELDQGYDLVIIAQSNRQSITQKFIDHLRVLTRNSIPLINLLGSWCEGEERSGQPLQHVTRIYWHQWAGQFQQLLKLPSSGNHSPPTPAPSINWNLLGETPLTIGISALCSTQASWVNDSLSAVGVNGVWLEQAVEQASDIPPLAAICLDSDSLTDALTSRIQWLHEEFPRVPVIALLNFPRINEVHALQRQFGVAQVLPKPCELSQLAYALTAVTGSEFVGNHPIPERFQKRSNPAIEVPQTARQPQ